MKCMVCDGEGVFQDECCVHCFGYGQVKNWIENLISNEKMRPKDFIFYKEIRNFTSKMLKKYDLNFEEGLEEEISEFVSWSKKRYKLKNFALNAHRSLSLKKIYFSTLIALPYKNGYVTIVISTIGNEGVLPGWYDPEKRFGRIRRENEMLFVFGSREI